MKCKHSNMYLEHGKLTCCTCGEDKTPLSGMRVQVVFSDYREKIIKSIAKAVEDLPEEVLQDIVQYAEYLKQRR